MKWKKIEENIQLLPLTFPHHTHKHLLDRQIGLLVKCLPCKSDNLKSCVRACMHAWCEDRSSKLSSDLHMHVLIPTHQTHTYNN